MKAHRLILVIILSTLIMTPCLSADTIKKGKPKKQSAVPVKDIKINQEEQSPQESATQITPDKVGSSTGEQINWQVLSGGGGSMSTTGYKLRGTMGQTATGWTSTAGQSVHQGYWQNFGEGTCCDTPGDANNDGICDIGDCAYVINYIFREGAYPVCMEEGDANVDCTVDVGDVVYVINYIFREGPYPECGCWIE